MATQLNHLYNTSSLRLKTQAKPVLPTKQRTTTFCVNAVAPTSNGRELVRSGSIKAIQPREAATAMSREGFVLLDIRPVWEREKARVKESIHVPFFIEDTDNSPITLLKKWVHFGYIGLWTGQYFTTLNTDFLKQVEEAVPDKDTKLLVACGEGLRSMMAASKLYYGGYKKLGWLAGGFNRVGDSDFSGVEGNEKLEFATIGGVSYYFLQLLILLRAVGTTED
ncbi:hypothetical protein UlMin_000606 [Ulmus minor]